MELKQMSSQSGWECAKNPVILVINDCGLKSNFDVNIVFLL